MRSAGFPVTYGGGRYAADTLDLPPVSRYGAGGYRRGYSGYNGGLELAAGRYAPTYLSDSVHRTYSGGYYGGAGMGSQVVDMKDTRNFYKPGVYTEARSDGRTDLPDVEVVVHPPHGSPPARSMQVSVTRPRPEFATTAGYRDVEPGYYGGYGYRRGASVVRSGYGAIYAGPSYGPSYRSTGGYSRSLAGDLDLDERYSSGYRPSGRYGGYNDEYVSSRGYRSGVF
jgi:hypothetical protein|mmetsp:Transcript_9127/g.17188  ORF Transcript_9127/g.17188 Transcript_9127/m.17188 type:complete len:226 (-) Transcript_9127:437-1114(-)